MQECLFCRILQKEIPSTMVFEDSETAVFRDINPQAPIHLLVVPKRHLSSLDDCTTDDEALLGHVLSVARDVAQRQGLRATGYRIILNTGEGAGQTVFHIHFHLLGGRRLSWPPG